MKSPQTNWGAVALENFHDKVLVSRALVFLLNVSSLGPEWLVQCVLCILVGPQY